MHEAEKDVWINERIDSGCKCDDAEDIIYLSKLSTNDYNI
jgi:hypothetical protein